MSLSRIKLVETSGLKSVYSGVDISNFNNIGQQGNFICPDMANALHALAKVVKKNHGEFYIIDLFRSWDAQAANRKDYEAGKKKAFVAKAGGSFHNAGRAVDIAVDRLNFVSLDKDRWLSRFWKIAKPLGFYPIIAIPDLDMSECWHFDFPGEGWKPAYDFLGYAEVAKCAILDVGKWDPKEKLDKLKILFIQSQLVRLGFYGVGEVDGILGKKTNQVLEMLGIKNWSIKKIIESFGGSLAGLN